MRRSKLSAIFLSVCLLCLGATSLALAEEKPQYGGIMKVAIQGDPPSLDMHQESTFLVTIPFAMSEDIDTPEDVVRFTRV